MNTTVAWPSSAQQLGCLCIISPLHGFNYHLLTSLFYMVSFTLYTPMTVLNVRSWIMHRTPILCFLFHFCPNLARLPHCVVSGFLLVKVYALAACSPCTWKCVPLVDLLNGLLWEGRNGMPPTPDTLHLGGSYHLHSSHRFFPLWVQLCSKKKKGVYHGSTWLYFSLLHCTMALLGYTWLY